MSFIEKSYKFATSAYSFCQQKHFRNIFFITLAFFLVVGFVFNGYAYSDDTEGKYNYTEVYEEVDEFSSSSTGVDGQHSHKSQGFRLVDSTGSLLDLTYPQGNENYEEILSNPNISPGAKLGLLGASEVGIHLAINHRPQIDVSRHLAQEWVPNYGTHVSSVYAGESVGAGGAGYQRLQASGIDDLWSSTRNIAYVLFVLVFIVAGFMIMFRHKMGGQTMVTVYNTLPNVVIGLVLVTFSFAIVGVIIDIGSLLMNIIAGYLGIETYLGADSVNPTSPLGVWGTYMHPSTGVTGELFSVGGLGTAITEKALGIVDVFLSGILAILGTLVAALLVAYVSIKIFITLLKAYAGILFDTIMAPIVLAIATIPGKQGMMKDWFNRIFKNVGTFVMVFLLINLPIFLWSNENFQFDMFGSNLTHGVRDGVENWEVVKNIISVSIGLYLLFIAGNVQKILEDWFPQTGGKGGAGAAQGAMGDMQKTPGIGGFFGGK